MYPQKHTAHWKNLSSFLEKISQAKVYIQYVLCKSSLDVVIYLQHKKIKYERNGIYLLFFFTKINNLRNKSNFS